MQNCNKALERTESCHDFRIKSNWDEKVACAYSRLQRNDISMHFNEIIKK